MKLNKDIKSNKKAIENVKTTKRKIETQEDRESRIIKKREKSRLYRLKKYFKF